MLKFLVVVSICVVSVNGNGFPYVQCPYNDADQFPGIVPCDADCINQHGAAGGECDDSDYCRCGQVTHAGNSTSLQCRPSFIGILDVAYQFVCNVDCQCNHGAVNGTCDFANIRCVCGADATTNTCPAPISTFQDYLNYINPCLLVIIAIVGGALNLVG